MIAPLTLITGVLFYNAGGGEIINLSIVYPNTAYVSR